MHEFACAASVLFATCIAVEGDNVALSLVKLLFLIAFAMKYIVEPKDNTNDCTNPIQQA